VSWEEDDGEDVAILNFSDELIEELGWSEDDLLEWTDNEDGTFSLVKTE
jgi:hypothetical protein